MAEDIYYIFQLLMIKHEEGNGNPLQYSCLEHPMDRGAWVGYSPRGRKESDRTEWRHSLTHIAVKAVLFKPHIRRATLNKQHNPPEPQFPHL